MDLERKKQEIKAMRRMRELRASIAQATKNLKNLKNEYQNYKLPEDGFALYHFSQISEKCKEEKKTAREPLVSAQDKAETKCMWVFFLAVAGSIALGIIRKSFWLGLLTAAASFALYVVADALIKKAYEKKRIKLHRQIDEKYQAALKEAKELDAREREHYDAALKEKQEEKKAEAAPKIQELERHIDQMEEEYRQISLISEKDIKKDADIIDKVLDLMESNRADTVKEALQEIDREKQRKAREAKEAMERELARQASLPGKVYFCVGSINTYSGKLQSVRNTIYVDGAPYGAGSPMLSSIQLNPGPHSIYAQIEEAGYIFTTATYSFNMEGNGSIYLKIMIKNARAVIYPYATEKDLLNDT